MYHEYFQVQYDDTSARISSNSWGAPSNGYDFAGLDTDAFMWDNQDFLVVYAAGNYGSESFYSIATPGHSKNALTVGASLNADMSFVDSGRNAFMISLDDGMKFQVSIKGTLVSPLSDRKFSNATILPIYVYSSENSCEFKNMDGKILKQDDVSNRILLFASIGTCTVNEIARKSQALNADLVLFSFMSQPMNDMEVYIPVGYLYPADVDLVVAKVKANDFVARVEFPAPFQMSDRSVPIFSSKGPTKGKSDKFLLV